MSARTFLFIALLVPAAAYAQWECDSLNIPSLQYSAFVDTVVEVRITNSGGWFSYPSLVVYDNNGDTLAWQDPNFFGQGPDQTYLLPVATGATAPVGFFDATIEVRSNDQLACNFFRPYTNLCPIDSCITLYPAVGGAPSAHQFDWYVTDAQGDTVATGAMTTPTNSTQARDTLCLPPGEYSLGMVDITGFEQGAAFQMIGSDWWASPTSPQVTVQSGMVSTFVLFEACFAPANTIPEITAAGIEASVVNGVLMMRKVDGSPIRKVDVLDAAGRLMRSSAGSSAAMQLNIADLAPGVLVVRVTDAEGTTLCRRIAWGSR